MTDFYQDPPRLTNLFRLDAQLQRELKRRLPGAMFDAWLPKFDQLGEIAATTMSALAEEAEANPPVHVEFDPWGRRVDEIRVSRAWDAFKEISARQGIVATGYDETLGDRRRVVQTALIHLFSGSSATYSCPLAMTDAATRVLLALAPAGLRDRLVPRLLSRDPKTFITSGQWMTERTGGSDVSGTSTVARPVSGDVYTLHGVKWFTSATTSEMALTLAKVEDKLTLFCVELERLPGGGLAGIRINRLKPKLGTRALPTAELTLDGVRATRLGDIGRGVANIAPMLNITRYYNAVASASHMARATFLAKDYAGRRQAFGKRISELPLHQRTLEELEAEASGALSLCFEIADLLGRVEAGTASEDERRRLRALVPIAKLTTGKQVVAHASETLECFGGAGYIEDTGLPRILRDAQVLPIWEGTTNVLSLDVLRAQEKDGALAALVTNLKARAGDSSIRRALEWAESDMTRIEEARRVAMTVGFAAEAVLLAESGADGPHSRLIAKMKGVC